MKLTWRAVILLAVLSYNVQGKRCSRQTDSSSTPARRVVCYYQNWSIWRPDDQKFVPADINANICTHLIYAYAKLQSGQEALAAFDPEGDIKRNGYEIFVGLKKDNPNLKVMISTGGGREGAGLFSEIANDPDQRTQFIAGAIDFIRRHNFDGFDLSWQWPGLGKGSSASDMQNYVLFAKEMRETIIKESQDTGLPELIFSIVTPKFELEISRGFNLQELSKYIDFFNVQSYNYHTSSDPTVHHLAPLYTLPDEEINRDFTVNSTVRAYERSGIDLQKINLGIPLFGLSFILADPDNTDIGAEVDEEGDGVERGALWYNQICKRVTQSAWTIRRVNSTIMGPYAFNNTLWVAYDDEEAVRNKARFARENGLGGIMFWSIDLDDFRASCSFRTYPLIRAGREEFGISGTTTGLPDLLPNPVRKTALPDPPFRQPTSLESSKSIPTGRPIMQPTSLESSKPIPTGRPIMQPTSLESKPIPTGRPIMQPTSSESKLIPTGLPSMQPLSSMSSQTGQVNTEMPGDKDDSVLSSLLRGLQISSQRDIIIQQFKTWVTHNYYGDAKPSPLQSNI